METSNQKKRRLLGEPPGTANGKLRKKILFELVKETGKNFCYRCGKEIKDINTFSIEHKKAWMRAENPREAFYDLQNISFSHLSCNVASRKVPTSQPKLRGENHYNSKLTWKQVEEIRQKLSENHTLISLSKEYNVDERNIALIRDNKTWKV